MGRILQDTYGGISCWQAGASTGQTAIIVIDFFLLRLAPGDAADALAAESGSATAGKRWRRCGLDFGLDQPVVVQFLAYLENLAHFSLGFSPLYNMPVSRLIAERLPGSLLLMFSALLLALLIGITAGVLMAHFAGRLPDRLLSVTALLFYSIPGFWIGLMLIVVFSVWFGWLPSGGAETIGADLTGFPLILDRLRHLILPATSLALFFIAIYARLVRASMLEVRDQDYVRTAVAKGLSS